MWLRGSTDVAHARQDIYDLLTGAIAAGARGSGQGGNGAQLTTDAWDALDGTNYVIRSPVTQKPWWKDDASNYRIMWRGMPRFALQTGIGATENVKIGTPTFSGAKSGGATRFYIAARVTTINAAAGDLTSTVVTYKIINADTGATDTADTTISGWSGASDTKVVKYGISLTLTLAGGESFTNNHIWWVRGYSDTYPQGVDYFPEGAKVKSGTVVLSSSSGGTNDYTLTTDYKLVQQADSYPLITSIASSPFAQTDWGGQSVFSGIEWQAGGTPPADGATYYLVDCDMYQGYLQIMGQSGGYLYFYAWDFWDPVAGKGRMCSYGSSQQTVITPPAFNNTNSPCHQVFTSTSPTSTWFINFWLSVKTDKIVWTWRGDPGNSGFMSQGTFQAAMAVATKEKSTWVLLTTTGYLGVCAHIPGASFYDNPYWGIQSLTAAPHGTNAYGLYLAYAGSGAQYNSLAMLFDIVSGVVLTGANPAALDGKWDLQSVYLYHTKCGQDTSGTYTDLTRSSGGIATKLRGFWQITNDNFASLDELVDGGSTYLLVDNANRGPSGSATLRYLAVLEE